VATFFQAWRRRQASSQAAEWDQERTEARAAVDDVPAAIRNDVRRVIETLIDGPDEQVEPALKELWRLLEPYPDVDRRFAQLRIVDDAVEFLKS
jgi:hypothetical protein